MRLTWQQARGVAALAAIACLQAACSTTGDHAATGPMPQSAPPLTLNAQQEQRAQALAHFSAGVSQELTRGTDAGLAEFQQSLKLDPQNPQLALHVAQIF